MNKRFMRYWKPYYETQAEDYRIECQFWRTIAVITLATIYFINFRRD